MVWRGLYYASVFILNIVIARVYKAGDSGVINFLINNLAFLLLLTSLSLESSLGYFSSKNEISANRLTGVSLLFALLSAFVSTGAVWVFAESQAVHVLPLFFVLPFVYVLGVVLTNYFSALFYARQQVVLPNVVMIVVNALVLGFALYEFNTEESIRDKEVFLLVFIGSFLLQGLVLFFTWCMTHGFKLQMPAKPEMKKIFNYAFRALIANVIFFLVYRVDYWFVESFCTNKDLGNYIQVSKLGQIFLLLPSIVATAEFTRTAGGKQEEIRNVIEIISRWLLLLYLIFVLAIVIMGKWLFPLVYGQSYDLMYGPFLLLSPGILALSTLSLLGAFNAGKNKISINIKGSAIALVVIIAGNLLLVPKYGIYAAALVSSVGYICFQVYVLYHFRKEYRSNILDFFIPKPSDWRMVKQFISQTK